MPAQLQPTPHPISAAELEQLREEAIRVITAEIERTRRDERVLARLHTNFGGTPQGEGLAEVIPSVFRRAAALGQGLLGAAT